MKNETDELNHAIRELEEKRARELKALTTQFHSTFDSLKPINLIKSTVKEVTASSEIRKNLLGNAIGIGTGIITKKLLVGTSLNPTKNILGTVLQFATANFVTKHATGAKTTVRNILSYYWNRRKHSKTAHKNLNTNPNHNSDVPGLNYDKKVFKN
ncbi:hypothetical protein [Marivirga sp.]|uniref:hypothetical protein n=1 Tax=Marivirga sp. TaxID=2018662 RepID=UPI002D7F9C61|nr:hypothetical protein [Marivirga sp.]HET8860061.1 hypothetical protein [Marivirga sp.]